MDRLVCMPGAGGPWSPHAHSGPWGQRVKGLQGIDVWGQCCRIQCDWLVACGFVASQSVLKPILSDDSHSGQVVQAVGLDGWLCDFWKRGVYSEQITTEAA